jgi:hypothetical protein
MASTTATLPTGQKVRTASQSPMVLFLDYNEGHGAFIHKRSANRATLMTERRKRPSARAFIVFTDGSGKVEEV